MPNNRRDELLKCPRCGAMIGLGKYKPLDKAGDVETCMADLVEVPKEEADRLLAIRAMKSGGANV